MKKTFATIFLLMAACTLLYCCLDSSPQDPLLQDPWRRTNSGWEKNVSWKTDRDELSATSIHPSLVAGFQVLASVGGLFAMHREDKNESGQER